jgi:hypothetical protein
MEPSDMAEHRLTLAQSVQALTIPRIVEELKKQRDLQECVTHVEYFPAKEARFVDFPEGVDETVRQLFNKRGIEKLFHQAESISKR